MALLSTTQHGIKWLKNFDFKDQATAASLIDILMLVSASEFISQINKQLREIEHQANKSRQTVALFSEREVEKKNYDISPFFPNSEIGRAVGDGIQPVEVDLKKQDVGSEGIVAAFITKFCKASSEVCISHPGPDILRKKKVRKIVLVTDFIGSGNRLYKMLDAFGKVATIKSWVSYHLVSFHVVCYSATEFGLSALKRHPLCPEVSVHAACPVIDEAFEGKDLGLIKLLCQRYPKRTSAFPLGYNNTGSLIAFSHGIPNNAPYILHGSTNGWKPLFEDRSTVRADIDKIADKAEVLSQKSEEFLKIREARKLLLDPEGELWIHAMLILYSIGKGFKTSSKISARTQLPLSSVRETLERAIEAKWLTPSNSLTVLGRRELKYIQRYELTDNALDFDDGNLYFPTQLRAS